MGPEVDQTLSVRLDSSDCDITLPNGKLMERLLTLKVRLHNFIFMQHESSHLFSAKKLRSNQPSFCLSETSCDSQPRSQG